LTREEAQAVLAKDEIKPRELKALLSAREAGVIELVLLDMREAGKHRLSRIKGTDARVEDMLDIEALNLSREQAVVIYCQAGFKSRALQKALKAKGFERVCNLAYGILAYQGECEHD
jgi:rhodanese-related sulfurtransferase